MSIKLESEAPSSPRSLLYRKIGSPPYAPHPWNRERLGHRSSRGLLLPQTGSGCALIARLAKTLIGSDF
jgi:hypothetical protein